MDVEETRKLPVLAMNLQQLKGYVVFFISQHVFRPKPYETGQAKLVH